MVRGLNHEDIGETGLSWRGSWHLRAAASLASVPSDGDDSARAEIRFESEAALENAARPAFAKEKPQFSMADTAIRGRIHPEAPARAEVGE